MLAAVQVDPILSILVVLSIGIILVSFVFKLLNQPYVIAYILVGVCMGPHGLQLITDESLISNLGSFGLILLLFFIGMEISLPG
jgi:CPA2 family monovalent cation:H+ antiporter-2